MGDRWADELADEFRHGFLADLTVLEAAVRENLAAGESHVAEGRQQADWRARAATDDWWSNGPPE